MGPMLSITPISINQDLQLSQALLDCDFLQLRHLFTAGRARPIDMILDRHSGEPVTLLEVSHSPLKSLLHTMLTPQATLHNFLAFLLCPRMLSRYDVLLQFLLDQGSPQSYAPKHHTQLWQR